MVNWFRGSDPEEAGLGNIVRKFEQMLEDGRHTFDAAANALLGGTDPAVIREDLFATDERINRTEQEVRRALVVHGSVHGRVSFPQMLVMMSLVKDAERIGDYAKNLFDLAVHSVGALDAEEKQRLVDLKNEISKLLVRARNIYDEQDEEKATAFLQDADRIQDQCDDAIHRLIKQDGNGAAAALAYRYFKRTVSHTGNIVTSLVMPVDKLDYYDEPKV